jgi:hypothetical protein
MKTYDCKFMTTTTTWADVVRCAAILTKETDGKQTFAPLHRVEGGFACGDDKVGAEISKSIRFKALTQDDCVKRWPSRNHTFDVAADDLTIFEGGETVQLISQGTHCLPFKKREFESHANIICQELGWYRFKKKHELGCCEKAEERWLNANKISLKRKSPSIADIEYDNYKKTKSLCLSSVMRLTCKQKKTRDATTIK